VSPKEAKDWINEVTGERVVDFYEDLKNGVILCKLLNSIVPGIVSRFVQKPKHPLEERENIKAYLAGCAALSIPSQELFTVDDLHSKKYLTGVLINIFSVGRQAQVFFYTMTLLRIQSHWIIARLSLVIKVIPGFRGKKLGVSYYVDLEEQEKRKRRKAEEQIQQNEFQEREDDRQMKRRLELEDEKRGRKKQKLEHDKERFRQRRLKKGRKDDKKAAQER